MKKMDLGQMLNIEGKVSSGIWDGISSGGAPTTKQVKDNQTTKQIIDTRQEAQKAALQALCFGDSAPRDVGTILWCKKNVAHMGIGGMYSTLSKLEGAKKKSTLETKEPKPVQDISLGNFPPEAIPDVDYLGNPIVFPSPTIEDNIDPVIVNEMKVEKGILGLDYKQVIAIGAIGLVMYFLVKK
tara:strand:+ start:631 stop:1182 length:552 start_codon:yes stop_codon:yes gene_type:complete